MKQTQVLLIEDNDLNRKLIQYVLEVNGYDVRCAWNGNDARRILTTWCPQLILMDIQLPEMDGFELTRRLRSDARLRDLPIVAVTSYAMERDREQARLAGCDGFITKPIDVRGFPDQIKAFVFEKTGCQ